MNPKLDMIFARRSVRRYTGAAVSPDQVQQILEAAMAAPSACAKDPWRFVVITQKDKLAAVASGLPNGKLLADAAVGIIVCGDMKAAHAEELSYLLQDCSAAIENMLLAVSALGLGACWLGVHPRMDRVEHLRRLTQLPETIMPVAVIALGQPAEKPAPRTRFRPDFVHQETW